LSGGFCRGTFPGGLRPFPAWTRLENTLNIFIRQSVIAITSVIVLWHSNSCLVAGYFSVRACVFLADICRYHHNYHHHQNRYLKVSKQNRKVSEVSVSQIVMSGNDFRNSQALRRRQKIICNDDVISSGRAFQTRGPANGKARLSTVDCLTGGTRSRTQRPSTGLI